MRHLLLSAFLLLLLAPARAQQRLAAARQRSYLTKVFRLTDEQTRRLYERGLGAARPGFFTQVVDSFATDTPRLRPLPLGYYLVAHTEGPQLVYALRTETDREVTLVDNQVDLSVVVRDSLGRLLPDAQVAVAGRPLPFDAATQSYRWAGGGQAGVVAVAQGGRTTYHVLSQTFPYQSPGAGPRRHRLGHWPLRAGRRVLYGFPLGYLTRPTRQLVRDLRHASDVSTGLVGLLRSPFNEDVREERKERREAEAEGRKEQPTSTWDSYVATSQPRYRPHGDTLQLKARVLRHADGRPCRAPLTLWLGEQYSSSAKRIATLRPARPGSYLYTLPLADTLGLRPDTYVEFQLKDRHDNTVAQGQFRLEDYELKNTRYTLRVAQKVQWAGQPQAIFLHGTDANDLNLLDARLQLCLTSSGVPATLHGRQQFVPDTLWSRRQPLDAVGETRLDVPATVVKDLNVGYYVQATFLNTDNERRTESTYVPFSYDPGELLAEVRGDSVYLSYRYRGQPRPHAAMLHVAATGNFRRRWLFAGPVQLPCAVRVDARAGSYVLSDSAHHTASVYLSEQDAGLSLRADRPGDSLVLALDNPHHLPVWYYLYQGNRLRYRGYGPALRLRLAHAGSEPWYASLHYYWGQQLRTAEYTLARPGPQLTVRAEQPALAYPGQRIRLRFAVTDERGRPVPNADLSSYAYTSQFEAPAPPALPELRPAQPVAGRQSLRRFQLSTGFDGTPAPSSSQLLSWRPLLGLDSLRFYQFLYPASGAFYEYRPAPGGLTQVAPFVVDSGRVQPVTAVYVDGQPGYIYGVNAGDAYTVVADSGYHTISVRTPGQLVTLRGVYLRHLHKLTLSIDANRPCTELQVEKRPATLNPDELLALHRSLLVFDSPPGTPVTLRQGRLLRPATPTNNGRYYGGNRYYGRHYDGSYTGPLVSGPFRPDSLLLRSGSSGGFRRKLLFEPLFYYTFGPALLKMQCLDPAQYVSVVGFHPMAPLPLAGFAYLETDLRKPAPASYPSRRHPTANAALPGFTEPVFDTPYSTPAGQGRLELRRVPPPTDTSLHELATPYCVLLTRPDQPKFIRLTGSYFLLHALPPGRYRLAVLLADSSCLAPAEDIVIGANGQTYFQLLRRDHVPPGPLSHRINRLLRGRRQRIVQAPSAPTNTTRVVVPAKPQPGWHVLRGQVTALASGEGLPGVTVLVPGTRLGTATAADGSFSLQLPPKGGDTLRFSYVGYETLSVGVRGQHSITVVMSADTKELDEVVVTALGVPREQRALGYAVSEVSADGFNTLDGKVPGVSVVSSGVPGSSSRITIRGNSSFAGSNQPLFVIDGVPFEGGAGTTTGIDPSNIVSISTLRGAAAASLYGSRGANGVVVITTRAGGGQVRSSPAATIQQFSAAVASLAAGVGALPEPPANDPRLALRRHFRDYAWWRPLLLTDARGQAHTDVTMPDDVTSWDSFVLASDDHGRLGQASGRIKSYKPLRAELALPRFLVAGDRTQLVGKSLNYGFDTAQVSTTFRYAGQVLRRQEHRVHPLAVDTLRFTAPATTKPAAATPDSVTLSFGLARADGYQDGEQRSIPLLPAGTRETVGTFATLIPADTTIVLPVNPALGEVTVRLESDAIPTLLSEIEHLQAYAYLCNEQAASKLKALLLERRIRAAQALPFKGDKSINFLVRKLLDGRHAPEKLLWGTWPASAVSPWATTHVLEALLAAEQAGYPVAFDRAPVRAYLLRELDQQLSVAATVAALPGRVVFSYYHSPDDIIRLLSTLHQLGAPADFRTYLARLDRQQAGRQPLDHYLALTLLRQQLALPYQLDTLRRYRQRTQRGGLYYADTLHPGSYFRYLLPDRVGNTLLAYRLLRAQGGHETELARLRAGLLDLRQQAGGHWGSTYEAAQILETIGPDLFAAGRPATFARAQLSGGLSQGVTSFPFTATLPASAGPVLLHKEGILPVYATAYQTAWNPSPAPVATAFRVQTTLAGQAGTQVRLRAGQPAELLVTVDVPAAARYVLLEVPIPAGCSYGEPAAPNHYEVHREYLRQQAGIFIDDLPVGQHEFRIALQPRYKGVYTINPAKAELVYFPTKFGRSASKQAVVE